MWVLTGWQHCVNLLDQIIKTGHVYCNYMNKGAAVPHFTTLTVPPHAWEQEKDASHSSKYEAVLASQFLLINLMDNLQ